VTAGFFNVSVFRSIIEADPGALRGMHTILVGGEAVPSTLVSQAAQVLDFRVLVNGYGPTENTTFSCCHRLTTPPEPERPFPIGRPIANSTAMVVGEGLVEVPVGAVGEIVVGGAGLARGYIGAPDLTAERFVTSPDGRRWYRTGDLGRWLPTGDLEYVGRRDDQVKIRGFRVELGEVEAALSACPGVRAAIAMALPGPAGLRLIGFAETAADGTALRKRLTQTLPDYMVPARVITVRTFPLTDNAKIDRRALADMSATDTARHTPPAPAPTRAHQQLTRLWCEILGIDHVGIHDNFFDLGGDSRTLVLLTERIRRTFRDEIRVVDVMANPTVAELARFLGTDQSATAPAERAAERARMRRERRR
jgi:acyl-coenzyme A synthetase/AMP-(fatty) acid ligase